MASKNQLACLALLALCVSMSMQKPFDGMESEEDGRRKRAATDTTGEAATDVPDTSSTASGSGGKLPGQQVIDQFLQPVTGKDSPASGFVQYAKPFMEFLSMWEKAVPGMNN